MPVGKFNSADVQRFFVSECFECFVCGKNNWDAIHHVRGRTFWWEESLLNYCPIHNNICHLYNQELNREEFQEKLLAKIFKHLKYKGYELKDIDKEFIRNNSQVYIKMSLNQI